MHYKKYIDLKKVLGSNEYKDNDYSAAVTTDPLK